MVVQHNLQAMNSNRMLGITVKQQAKSTEKLSSGYKINRAADDAAGLSISEKMRKQIRGLTQASLNAADGISAVQTAEGALHEVQDMLQRMNELAVKASNGTNSEDDRNYIQDEIDQLITEIDRISETTKFNEAYLLKGDKDTPAARDFKYKDAAVVKDDMYFIENGEMKTIKKGTLLSAVDKTKTYYSQNDGLLAGIKAADADTATYFSKVTVVSGTDYWKKAEDGTYAKVNAGETYNSNAEYFTAAAGIAGGTVSSSLGKVTANFATQDQYVIAAGQTLYDKNGDTVSAGKNVGANSAAISDYYKTVTKAMLDPADSIADVSTFSASASVQFVDANGNEIAQNGLYRYLDKDGNLLNDAELYVKTGEGIVDRRKAQPQDVTDLVDKNNFFEVGSLSLKLHVGADSTKNNQITLDLDSISSKVLGINNIRVNGKDDTNALDAIETVKEAIQRVSTQRSALGAVQNRLEHTINNLDNVVENTTAAESQIRDTDMATEMVRYSNNNILAQAGQAMLAQANQSNQGVLSILG